MIEQLVNATLDAIGFYPSIFLIALAPVYGYLALMYWRSWTFVSLKSLVLFFPTVYFATFAVIFYVLQYGSCAYQECDPIEIPGAGASPGNNAPGELRQRFSD